MGLFDSNCTNCGSKEHASENCPHGLFSSKCSKCGSKEHNSSDCPHALFSSKCSKCGSKEHNSSDCPHGLFSSKCSKCGSKEHSSSDCPHGLFSKKCGKCGSINHATKDCPQGSLGGLFNGSSGSSTAGASGMSGLIAFLVIIAIILAIFSSPFKLIDPNFNGFSFKWLDNKDVWVFSSASWLTGLMILYLLNKAIKHPKARLEDRFSNPYISLPLFTLASSIFSTTFLIYRFNENYITYSILVDILYLLVVFLFVRFSEKNKKIIILSISILTMAIPFIYHAYYSDKFPIAVGNVEIVSPNWYIKSNIGANLRESPNKKGAIITTIPNSQRVEYLNDSSYSNNIIWYRVKYNEQEGWISKSLISNSQ